MTVQKLLDELQAQRDAEWEPERLREHAAFRRGLAEAADPERIVRPGDVLPATALTEVDDGALDVDALLATGPVVLVFFRFAGCPADNAALPGYAADLAAPLAELGAHLVAVSPQAPGPLADIKHRHGLPFRVASDTGQRLVDAFGIGFASPGAADVLGTGRDVLPYPTVVVVDSDRVVRFADARPDWMVRTPAEPVLDAVRGLV